MKVSFEPSVPVGRRGRPGTQARGPHSNLDKK